MRLIIALIAFVLVPFGSAAAPFGIDDLRAAVAANDIDKVNAGLDAAQEEYLAGQRSPDDMRALYVVLSRSVPDTVAFVEKWLESEPHNNKAQIARGWSLWNKARFLRWGNNYYAEAAANPIYNRVYELVVASYLADPDLIPASDAVLRELGRNNMVIHSPLEEFERVMKIRPNWGSVERIIPSISHLAGTMLTKFCAGVAEDFPQTQQSIINHRCLLATGHVNRSDRLRAQAREILWEVEDPGSIYEQILFLVGTVPYEDWTEEEIAWGKEQLMTYEANQFEFVPLHVMAERLSFIAQTAHGQADPFIERYRMAQFERAETFLKHDPNNLDLLRIVEKARNAKTIEYYTNEDGEQRYRLTSRKLSQSERALRDANEVDLNIRRLQVAPYYAAFWESFARDAQTENMPETLFDGDKAMQNFIIYSDDPAAALRQLMSDKRNHYDTLKKARDQSGGLANWVAFYENTDPAEQIFCPYLRAYTLHERFCAHYPQGSHQCLPFTGIHQLRHAEMYDLAIEAPACAGYPDADIEDLWYAPVDFNEATGRF